MKVLRFKHARIVDGALRPAGSTHTFHSLDWYLEALLKSGEAEDCTPAEELPAPAPQPKIVLPVKKGKKNG